MEHFEISMAVESDNVLDDVFVHNDKNSDVQRSKTQNLDVHLEDFHANEMHLTVPYRVNDVLVHDDNTTDEQRSKNQDLDVHLKNLCANQADRNSSSTQAQNPPQTSVLGAVSYRLDDVLMHDDKTSDVQRSKTQNLDVHLANFCSIQAQNPLPMLSVPSPQQTSVPVAASYRLDDVLVHDDKTSYVQRSKTPNLDVQLENFCANQAGRNSSSTLPQNPPMSSEPSPEVAGLAQPLLEDLCRRRACNRVAILMPSCSRTRFKCTQSLTEKWASDDWIDWWHGKLFSFHDPDYENIGATKFMHDLWYSEDDEFLKSWPYWSLHHD